MQSTANKLETDLLDKNIRRRNYIVRAIEQAIAERNCERKLSWFLRRPFYEITSIRQKYADYDPELDKYLTQHFLSQGFSKVIAHVVSDDFGIKYLVFRLYPSRESQTK